MTTVLPVLYQLRVLSFLVRCCHQKFAKSWEGKQKGLSCKELGSLQAVAIYTDDSKGMLTPAALVDIDGDFIDDIVVSTFNSHVVAIR